MSRRFLRWRTCALAVAGLVAAACNPAADAQDGGHPALTDAKASADAGPPADGGGSKDAGPKDAGPSTDAVVPTGDATAPAGDAAVLPPPDAPVPALFDPNGPAATAYDAPLASLLVAWNERPTDEAGAQDHVRRLQDALAAIRDGGPAAADRIADVCVNVPPEAVGPSNQCLRLLSLVDSPRSLDLLAQRAKLVPPPYPEGAHPVDPPPAGLARQVALRSLVLRSRAGTKDAADLLVRLAGDPENVDRGPAVAAVLQAMPRVVAKKRLRAVLPPEELYRLYQTR